MKVFQQIKNLKLSNDVVVDYQLDIDSELSITSENPLKNSVITDNFNALNEKIDNLRSKDDYTSFELFPTNIEIPAEDRDNDIYVVDSNDPSDPHSVANIFNFDNITATGLTYKVAVPASMTTEFSIYSYVSKEDCDLIIDFGDGTILDCAKTEDTEIFSSKDDDDGTFIFTVKYTYSNPGKYIVTIQGGNYFKMRHNIGINRLLSNCLNKDLRLYSGIVNTSSFAIENLRLLKLGFSNGDNHDYYRDFPSINLVSMFTNCKNLQYAYGLAYLFSDKIILDASNFFSGCTNLIDTDFRFPINSYNNILALATFKNCNNLSTAIENLFPPTGFAANVINFTQTFENCKKLTGTVPAHLLWDDTSKIWESSYYYKDIDGVDTDVPNFEPSFQSCSQEIRAQVPLAWGGTNTSIQVPYRNITMYDYLDKLIRYPDNLDEELDATVMYEHTNGKVRELGSKLNYTFLYRKDVPLAPTTAEIQNPPDISENTDLVRVDRFSSNIERISTFAFYNCTELTNVNFSNIEDINGRAFSGCTKLVNIDSSKIKTVYAFAFTGCTALESVNLPNCELINAAFSGCTNLTDVRLDNIINLGNSSFKECSKLVNFYAPKATKMQGQVFFMCSSLERLELPSMVDIQYTQTFLGCNNLKELYLNSIDKSTVEANKNNWNIPSGCVVTCKNGDILTVL